MDLIIEFKADQAIAAMQRFPQRTQRATVRALNRALVTGRALMASLIAKDMGVSVKLAREQVVTVQAVESRLEVRLQASLKRVPLIKLGAKGPEPSRGRGTGVSYKIGPVRARLASAFIATMKSGHRGVYRRVGTKRLSLTKELRGPSFGHVFDRHRPAVVAAMTEAFDKRLVHELRFADTEGSGAD